MPKRTKYRERLRDTPRMLWIKTLSCAIPDCRSNLPVEGAHVKTELMSSNRKPPDDQVIPLCGPGFMRGTGRWSNEAHHREGKHSIHKMGPKFWDHHKL